MVNLKRRGGHFVKLTEVGMHLSNGDFAAERSRGTKIVKESI